MGLVLSKFKPCVGFQNALFPFREISTTEGAKISGGAVNNMKDKFSFYLSEKRVKLLHKIMIYFCRQMNKNKSKKSHRKKICLGFEPFVDWVE